MRPVRFAFIASAALLAAADLDAQQAGAPASPTFPEVVPGARIRLEAPNLVAGKFEGTVLERSGDTVVVASGPAVRVRIPLDAMTALAVSRGKSRGAGAVRVSLQPMRGGLNVGLALRY